ncbi:hypothetical protein GFL93_09335 [Rhizobium leguminosarum bv. viciae]|uniref:hypothetical protein n=1 Tax=Rhizobium TaxID=379 RepID=UPI0014414AF5|nr:hypothetical protein [Rhizobium leguminosarum]NKK06073.1 hypothetical protein [Rhizobium leguminosarum bv. viciae]
MNSYTDESGFDGVVPAHPIECDTPHRTLEAAAMPSPSIEDGYDAIRVAERIVDSFGRYMVKYGQPQLPEHLLVALENEILVALNNLADICEVKTDAGDEAVTAVRGAPELEEHLASAHLRGLGRIKNV